MEAPLSSYQSMIVAPLLYPGSEAPEAIQVEAHGLIKMVFDVCHKIHRASFFEAQCFLLILEEVFEKLLLEPCPFCLLKAGNVVLVIDLEHMLQVLLQTTTVKFCHQSCRITKGGSWLTFPLRLGSFRCRWWWNTWCGPRGQIALLMWQLCTCLLLHTSWVTDGSAAASLLSRVRSSVVL